MEGGTCSHTALQVNGHFHAVVSGAPGMELVEAEPAGDRAAEEVVLLRAKVTTACI